MSPTLGLGVEPKASGGDYLPILGHHLVRWKLGGSGRSMEPFLSKRLSCKDGGGK